MDGARPAGPDPPSAGGLERGRSRGHDGGCVRHDTGRARRLELAAVCADDGQARRRGQRFTLLHDRRGSRARGWIGIAEVG